jgi:hypothetical protein
MVVTPTLKPLDPLAALLVNHADTVGLSSWEVEKLRPQYVIDGFLRRGHLLLLGAESKSRKSWLAQDAGFAVASGTPWLDDGNGGGFRTAQATVHVLDLELDRDEIRYRFAKARLARFQNDRDKRLAVTEHFRHFAMEGESAEEVLGRAPRGESDHGVKGWLEKIAPTVKPGDLVIVDCFYRLVPDSNETRDVVEALEKLKAFARTTGAGMIVVDHFRKAGDDKARNRFNGTFAKQASASTLVAVEVIADDTLEMNIDARTFHGTPKVHARFDLQTYTFRRVTDGELAASREAVKKLVYESWVVALWLHLGPDAVVTKKMAAGPWRIGEKGSEARFKALIGADLVRLDSSAVGKASAWALTATGKALLPPALPDSASGGNIELVDSPPPDSTPA